MTKRELKASLLKCVNNIQKSNLSSDTGCFSSSSDVFNTSPDLFVLFFLLCFLNLLSQVTTGIADENSESPTEGAAAKKFLQCTKLEQHVWKGVINFYVSKF